ncbi:hypothetical protein B0H13DRAFT_532026 [Mycena leptocephala]|nr:hypothetical protein B0H13DRAFT_532026 [Mycena leptocephala]
MPFIRPTLTYFWASTETVFGCASRSTTTSTPQAAPTSCTLLSPSRARVKYLAAMTVVRKNGVYVGGAGARFFFFFFPTATPIPIACGFLSSYHYRSCPFHVPPGDPYFGERALTTLYLSFFLFHTNIWRQLRTTDALQEPSTIETMQCDTTT